MASRPILDAVILQRPVVLELLPSEDQSLLVGGDALLVLEVRLVVAEAVGGLDAQRERQALEGLDKELRAAAQAQHLCTTVWPKHQLTAVHGHFATTMMVMLASLVIAERKGKWITGGSQCQAVLTMLMASQMVSNLRCTMAVVVQ